jgi:hypothetical protein
MVLVIPRRVGHGPPSAFADRRQPHRTSCAAPADSLYGPVRVTPTPFRPGPGPADGGRKRRRIGACRGRRRHGADRTGGPGDLVEKPPLRTAYKPWPDMVTGQEGDHHTFCDELRAAAVGARDDPVGTLAKAARCHLTDSRATPPRHRGCRRCRFRRTPASTRATSGKPTTDSWEGAPMRTHFSPHNAPLTLTAITGSWPSARGRHPPPLGRARRLSRQSHSTHSRLQRHHRQPVGKLLWLPNLISAGDVIRITASGSIKTALTARPPWPNRTATSPAPNQDKYSLVAIWSPDTSYLPVGHARWLLGWSPTGPEACQRTPRNASCLNLVFLHAYLPKRIEASCSTARPHDPHATHRTAPQPAPGE